MIHVGDILKYKTGAVGHYKPIYHVLIVAKRCTAYDLMFFFKDGTTEIHYGIDGCQIRALFESL